MRESCVMSSEWMNRFLLLGELLEVLGLCCLAPRPLNRKRGMTWIFSSRVPYWRNLENMPVSLSTSLILPNDFNGKIASNHRCALVGLRDLPKLYCNERRFLWFVKPRNTRRHLQTPSTSLTYKINIYDILYIRIVSIESDLHWIEDKAEAETRVNPRSTVWYGKVSVAKPSLTDTKQPIQENDQQTNKTRHHESQRIVRRQRRHSRSHPKRTANPT